MLNLEKVTSRPVSYTPSGQVVCRIELLESLSMYVGNALDATS